MITHTHLSELHKLYLSETQPFRKVHRMIDLFESIIKTHTAVIISEYVQHNNLSDTAKGLLSQGLRTPSLGTWQLFSRVLIQELEKEAISWKLPSFVGEFHDLDAALNKEKTNVIAFRNGYAHGATPTDEQCELDISKFDPFLTKLLNFQWLLDSSTIVEDDKVYLSSSDQLLSLHPILLYRDEKEAPSIAFFNDIKNDKVGLLNYPLGKHYREKNFLSEFHQYIPIDEWKKTGNNEFEQRVEQLTETFKGRTSERANLLEFVSTQTKGYLSIQGNPGIGKSALIAQFFKDIKGEKNLQNVLIVEYFIRRGTPQAQSEFLINYLNKRTDDVFPQGKEIRAEGKMIFELQNQLFSKWRLWDQHANGRKLVFLIDGLDEGVENDILTYLPREVFENVLFIYSSRPGGHKSIDDFWGALPIEHHTKLELSNLGKNDIRAMIYDVANKYELERESPWIDAVQKRSQGNPLYLKLLCNSIENGEIELNDIQKLPSTIDDYYKAIVLRYANNPDGDDLLNSLFTFAAAKDYLTFDHLKLINQLGTASIVRIGAILKEVLYENPLTEEIIDYQLFHESFREYLISTHSREINDATQRIIAFCETWNKHQGTWEQRYALEFYSSHLFEHKEDERRATLISLMHNDNYCSIQKQVLKSFNATNTLYKKALQYASDVKLYQNELEAALRIVDIRYEEANDSSQILEMISNGEIDLALKRIESFGGLEKEGLKRKFILYILCLFDLHFLRSEETSFQKDVSEKLLNHLDEHLPVDHSILNWKDFFPPELIFRISCELARLELNYQILYKRTLVVFIDNIENINYGTHQFDVSYFIANNINNEYQKCKTLTSIAVELSKQGYLKKSKLLMQESQNIANRINDIVARSMALTAITSGLAMQGHIEESLGIARILTYDHKCFALSKIATELAKRGQVKESYSLMEESLTIAREINDPITMARGLMPIAIEFSKQSREKESYSLLVESLTIARGIKVENYGGILVMIEIAIELFKQGKVEKSTSLFNESLIKAKGIPELHGMNYCLEKIAVEFVKQGNLAESLEIVEGIYLPHIKFKLLRMIATELVRQGKLVESVAITQGMSGIGAWLDISAELFKQGKVYESVSMIRESLNLERGIIDIRDKENMLAKVAVKISTTGQFNKSLKIARSITSPSKKINTLTQISVEQLNQGYQQDFAIVIDESITVARSINDRYLKSFSLKVIARVLNRQEQLQKSQLVMCESLAVAREIKSKYYMQDSLKEIAIEMVKQGQTLESLALARELKELEDGGALRQIAAELFEQGNLIESSTLMQESLTIARGKKTDASLGSSNEISSIAIELFTQGKLDEAASLLDESLTIARGLKDDVLKNKVLPKIAIELTRQGQIEKSVTVMKESLIIARKLNQNAVLKLFAIEMARQTDFLTTEKLCEEITEIALRLKCWEEIAHDKIKVLGWENSLVAVNRLNSKEARLLYLRGWVHSIEFKNVTDDLINRALNLIVEDSIAIELLLNKYATNEIALGRYNIEKFDQLNRSLNLNWLMGIVSHSNEPLNQNTRNSNNLKKWLHEITDEDDRDQIQLWAKLVAKGKITEKDFCNKLESLSTL